MPAAYGTDLGVNVKPFKNVYVNLAIWQLFLQQEFVYVGDAGIVEPSGKTNRIGADLSIRFQPFKKLFIDVNTNHSKARAIGVTKGENYLPLAPNFTSTGGITYKSEKGFNGSLRYRYMGDRPANEDYSYTAKGYFISDALIAYTKPKFECSVSAQNIFNMRWKETQFLTESQLKNEVAPVSEIHFTPGSPFFIKTSFTYFF